MSVEAPPVAPAGHHHRRLTWLLVVALLLGSAWLTGCGDDARSTGSTWRVLIEPCRGRTANRAMAGAVAPDLLVTVAHSFSDAGPISIHQGDEDAALAADLVYLDADKDIALLRTRQPLDEHLELDEPDGPGPVGVLRFGEGDGTDGDLGRIEVDPAEILELVDATLDGEGRRAAARLEADIEPGDSGAPVVDPDGRMVAMVFASGRGGPIGWAVSGVELLEAVRLLGAGGPGAQPPTC
ncbi:MAG: serine protease [Actinomycetota bacterium]